MATQKTISISGDWQSLNALSGATVGAQIDAQVSRGRGVKVATSTTAPDGAIDGFQFNVGEFFRSESGANECWVRASLDGDLGKLEVEY
jgi:outer membrane lipoprotein SlyB